jgi:hypothetical protein
MTGFPNEMPGKSKIGDEGVQGNGRLLKCPTMRA